MPAQFRTLGKNGPKVSALGLGLMGLGFQIYGDIPADDERFALLDRAHELGATFWDTADMYGDSESIIGKWFKRTGKRDDIFLATKFGFVKGSMDWSRDTAPETCKARCEDSLRALGVDSIDLYYIHSVDNKTPIEATMRAMAELQKEGKIKHIGLSNVSSDELRRAVKIAPVAAIQLEYAAFSREIEGPDGTHLLATCRELGVAVIAYSPLGRGQLTTNFVSDPAVSDTRAQLFPRFSGEAREKNVQLVREFTALADKKGCSTAQLAIAWLLKQGDDIIPIPGTKKIKYLEENWAALKVELTDEEEKQIREFVEKSEVAGGLIPPGMEEYRFASTVAEA